MPTFIDPNDPNGQNAQNNDEQNTESTSRRHDTNRRSKDNDYTPYLKSIDDSLKQILKDGINVSQSNARTFRDTQFL